jgi:hypothetical protein
MTSNCGHLTQSFDRSSYYLSLGSGQGCPLLRASNEHRFTVRVLRARRAPGRSLPILLRPRVARAQETIRLPFSSLPSSFIPSQGWGLIDLPLRASNEGLLRPRVARAREINRLHPLLCEQEGRPGCCLSSPIQTAVM